MAQRRSDRERYKYGICLNDECSKCKSKEVQQISARKEFVCEECGAELRECPPPKKTNPKPIIIGVVAVLLLGGIGAAVALLPKSEPQDEPAPVEQVAEEPAPAEPAVEPEPAPEPEPVAAPEPAPQEPKKAAPAQPKLDYGKWNGGWKNGLPHGTGTMTYTKQHLIDKRDPQQRTAEKGDYIMGEFYEGKLVQGVWKGADNEVKGHIMIGR
ncbi:MAG: hypothetical protein IJ609_01055 [Paludibacteraceae bacterium]|nr:hypothetical protein [Paludibacteraceae bacterium]MBR1480508.1 hypothetical protein [Paludibacteraceae bacterium]